MVYIYISLDSLYFRPRVVARARNALVKMAIHMVSHAIFASKRRRSFFFLYAQ